MTIQIQRPKDLTATNTIADNDYLVLDRGEAGVFKVSIAQLTTFFIASTFSQLGSTGESEPEGVVIARPPAIYFQIVEDGTITLWIKVSGVDTSDGWVAFAQGKP